MDWAAECLKVCFNLQESSEVRNFFESNSSSFVAWVIKSLVSNFGNCFFRTSLCSSWRNTIPVKHWGMSVTPLATLNLFAWPSRAQSVFTRISMNNSAVWSVKKPALFLIKYSTTKLYNLSFPFNSFFRGVSNALPGRD